MEWGLNMMEELCYELWCSRVLACHVPNVCPSINRLSSSCSAYPGQQGLKRPGSAGVWEGWSSCAWGQAERANTIQETVVITVVLWGGGCFLQEHPESKLSLEEVFLIKALDSAMRASQSLVGRNGTREGLRSTSRVVPWVCALMPSGV